MKHTKTKRAKPRQHKRRLPSGKTIVVNRGIPKRDGSGRGVRANIGRGGCKPVRRRPRRMAMFHDQFEIANVNAKLNRLRDEYDEQMQKGVFFPNNPTYLSTSKWDQYSKKNAKAAEKARQKAKEIGVEILATEKLLSELGLLDPKTKRAIDKDMIRDELDRAAELQEKLDEIEELGKNVPSSLKRKNPKALKNIRELKTAREMSLIRLGEIAGDVRGLRENRLMMGKEKYLRKKKK